MCVWSQFLTIDHRSENFKGPNLWIIWDCVWETHKESQRVRVCVCVCVSACQSFSPSLTTWLSGPERNWDTVFSGIWRQGRCHRDHRVNKHDVKHTNTQTHTHRSNTHACTRTQIRLPPFALTLAFRFHTTGPPSNVHSHMHKRAHKHTHYATRSQTLLVCVWNERRVVRKNRLPEKRALPSLRDKHHSVTRFSGHCFLTVYFLLRLSVCPSPFSLSLFNQLFC